MLISLATQDITSICSIFIASLAIGLTVWQGVVQRRHNRLGVQPNLAFSFSITTESASIKVKNCGLGPACISSYHLLIDSKSAREMGIQRWEQLTEYLGLDFPVTHSSIEKGDVIPPGVEIPIISLTIEEYKPEKTKQIRNAFRKLSFHIEYSSFYKEHFEVSAAGREKYGESE